MAAPPWAAEVASDRPSAALRRLIDEADASAAALGAVLDRAAGRGDPAARGSLLLQERLRVGARMLLAIQTQIGRAEAAAGHAVARRREVLTELERAVDGRLAHLAALEERIAGLTARAERLIETVESAEVNIAALCHRTAASARRFDERVRAAATGTTAAADPRPITGDQSPTRGDQPPTTERRTPTTNDR